MTEQTQIPADLRSALGRGLNIAAHILDRGDGDHQGHDLADLATVWEAVFPVRFSITPAEAAELKAVVAEAVEYALTCHYDAEADAQDFPEDYEFATKAEPLMQFLNRASAVLARG